MGAVLHPQVRPVVVFQTVADGVVVGDAVAGGNLVGVFARDVTGGLADPTGRRRR